MLTLRRLYGRILRLLELRSYGHCQCCHTPWSIATNHTTSYTTTRGMFPLCEPCWRDLRTPARRLPYYRALWEEWERTVPNHACWEDIEQAVLAEGLTPLPNSVY